MADIRRAQVWMNTDVAAMNLRTGPADPGAFAPDALVPCEYVDKPQKGRTPKFTCSLGDHDDVKVKYGEHNGEVTYKVSLESAGQITFAAL